MIPEYREKQHWQMLMPEKLSHELLEAFHNQDPVVKKKHDMHKMAKTSRPWLTITGDRGKTEALGGAQASLLQEIMGATVMVKNTCGLRTQFPFKAGNPIRMKQRIYIAC